MSKTIDNSRAFVFKFLPGPIMLLILLFTLTGNCGMCGFDKDYLCAWTKCGE